MIKMCVMDDMWARSQYELYVLDELVGQVIIEPAPPRDGKRKRLTTMGGEGGRERWDLDCLSARKLITHLRH